VSKVDKANAINAEGKPNNDRVRARLRVGITQAESWRRNNYASQPGHKNNLLPIKAAAGCCINSAIDYLIPLQKPYWGA